MLKIQKDIFLAPYTTFRIGGLANYFAEASNTEEIRELCNWAKEKGIPILILGGGSNVLVSDKGFEGLVIKIRNSKFEISARGGSQPKADGPRVHASGGKNSGLRIKNSRIFSEAWVPLAKIVAEAVGAGLSGLEWAMGIPGTVGGAINGNAGAFGKSTSGSVEKVEVFDIAESKVRTLKNEECRFGYRNSLFKRNPNLIILSATFNFKKGNPDEMQKTIKDFVRQRLESIPSGYSAGSFFKNVGWEEVGDKEEIISKFPELKQFSEKPKISAGFLIDYLGLKGKKIGDAAVSEKHANFILNLGNASAEQVVMLRNLIKERVHSHYGFNLEDEVVSVGL